ncbi:TPA: DUF3265 domain-containing protein [Vibrio vulnificus]|nr:DUF3265 domain-containing protein [Vibrio vulnificus]HDY7892141.1 DUF3265 domain-containing protein [Vibrio vulnificus]
MVSTIFAHLGKIANKAFKWDSCRVAFLVCSDFRGESGLRKVGLCGTHPLTRRYASVRSLGDNCK